MTGAVFTANLCNVDGRDAGCGFCVRLKGLPVTGTTEMHQGPGGRRDRFYVVEKCPFCEERREEHEIAAHVREAHGGATVVQPAQQLGLGLDGAAP